MKHHRVKYTKQKIKVVTRHFSKSGTGRDPLNENHSKPRLIKVEEKTISTSKTEYQ
jgi:hypothetical protein